MKMSHFPIYMKLEFKSRKYVIRASIQHKARNAGITTELSTRKEYAENGTHISSVNTTVLTKRAREKNMFVVNLLIISADCSEKPRIQNTQIE